MYAAKEGDVNTVTQLLTKKSVTAKDSDGKTALMHALESKHANADTITDAILKHPDVDLNAQDLNKKTALMYAAEKDDWNFVEKLIKNGADISLKDNNGKYFTSYIGDRVLNKLLQDENINENLYQLLTSPDNFTKDKLAHLKKNCSFTYPRSTDRPVIKYFVKMGAIFTFKEMVGIHQDDELTHDIVIDILKNNQFVPEAKKSRELLENAFKALQTSEYALTFDHLRKPHEYNLEIISLLLSDGLTLNKDQLIETKKLEKLIEHCWNKKEAIFSILTSISQNTKPAQNYSSYQRTSPPLLPLKTLVSLFDKVCEKGFTECSDKILEILDKQQATISRAAYVHLFETSCNSGSEQFAEKLLDLVINHKLKISEKENTEYSFSLESRELHGEGKLFIAACKQGFIQTALKATHYPFEINSNSFNKGLQLALQGKHTKLVEALMQEIRFKSKNIDAKTFHVACKNGYEKIAFDMLDRVERDFCIEDDLLKSHHKEEINENNTSSLNEDNMIEDLYNNYSSDESDTNDDFVWQDNNLNTDDNDSIAEKEIVQPDSRDNLLLIACNNGCKKLACDLTDRGLSLNEDLLEKYADPEVTKAIEEYNKTTTIQWVYDGDVYKIQYNPGETFTELKQKMSEELDIQPSKFEIYIGDTHIFNDTVLQSKLVESQNKGPINLTIKIPFELNYIKITDKNDSNNTKSCRFFMTMDNNNKLLAPS